MLFYNPSILLKLYTYVQYSKIFKMIFSWVGLGGLNSGIQVCKAGVVLYYLSYTSSPFCSGYFGDGGVEKYLLRLVSNHNPPDLSIPSS
jgi:hypothetical protein